MDSDFYDAEKRCLRNPENPDHALKIIFDINSKGIKWRKQYCGTGEGGKEWQIYFCF